MQAIVTSLKIGDTTFESDDRGNVTMNDGGDKRTFTIPETESMYDEQMVGDVRVEFVRRCEMKVGDEVYDIANLVERGFVPLSTERDKRVKRVVRLWVKR